MSNQGLKQYKLLLSFIFGLVFRFFPKKIIAGFSLIRPGKGEKLLKFFLVKTLSIGWLICVEFDESVAQIKALKACVLRCI